MGGIVEADKLDSRNQGRKRQPIFLGGGGAHSTKSASVKGILQSEESMLPSGRRGGLPGRAAKQTSQLHRTVDRFRSASRKEHAIHTGPFGELESQRYLKSVVIQIGEMNCARGFAADDLDDAGMGGAKGVDGN